MIIKHMQDKHFALIIIFLFFSIGLSSAVAADFHAPPRDFLFGNHIDTHQESKLKLDDTGNPESLSGFLYIIFTGEIDPISGLPVARHPRGAGENEECGVDPIDCVKGWNMNGIPADAKFLYHQGVNGDHPVWLVNRVDIPQPGSFTHFHWITTTSNDPGVASVPDECDAKNASALENNVKKAKEDVVCPGWFLEIQATMSFAFEHGGERVPIFVGIDNASHLNLVTNYESVKGIEATR